MLGRSTPLIKDCIGPLTRIPSVDTMQGVYVRIHVYMYTCTLCTFMESAYTHIYMRTCIHYVYTDMYLQHSPSLTV